MRLPIYVVAVTTLGLVAATAVLALSPWREIFEHGYGWSVAALALAAVLGEVRPIRMSVDGSQSRRLSTSAPFVVALLGIAGLAVALAVQLVASVADDVVNRRNPRKSLFNAAQYALSVVVGGVVFSALSGGSLLGAPATFGPELLVPLLLGGLALVTTNWILVAVVYALATGQALFPVMRADARHYLVTQLVLLSIGGIAALIAADGVGSLALLVAPVVAAHLFSAAVARNAHEATHDRLTDLGNREHAMQVLRHTLEQAEGADGASVGLVVLDLDHFKDVNDTLGHPVGDVILQQAAARIAGVAPDDGAVFRLGGDEFAIVVPGTVSRARAVADAALASLDAPVDVADLGLLVRASAGVAVAPQHGTDVETLMKNADIALYHAKQERDRISTYSTDYDVNSVDRLQLLTDLRVALDTDQLSVVYQPQVDLGTGTTVAAEALVRWRHPQRGLIPPEEFVPLAEKSGLIFPITALVLEAAMEQVAQWRQAGHKIRVAVNLSARHLSDSTLPDQIGTALSHHGVPASALVLEVTETSILSDAARADRVLRALRQLGVEIAIDDFGTGNASLSYLKRLEVDELKIDRTFVRDIGDDHHDLIIVRSTISLARDLGLRVVAEGVEHASTAQALAGLGGVLGQGFHLGIPMDPADLARRLDEQRAASRSATGR